MTPMVVYCCASRSYMVQKEALVYESIELALASLGEVEKHVVPASDFGGGYTHGSLAGLNLIKSKDPIIALGKAAHTVLADYQKRTLIAGDLALDGPEDDGLAQDIRRFVWSCINTLKVVALGEGAWRSVQMLPLASRRFHAMPPLRIEPSLGPDACDGILVINHDADERPARRLVAFLERHNRQVACAGLCHDRDSYHDDAGWSGEHFFHVHVGHHTIAAEEPRIVDSWHSRRLAIQLLPAAADQPDPVDDVLLIADEVNGFRCATVEDVLIVCNEIRLDPVLRRLVLDAGSRTAAPLARHWVTIAEDLLA